MMLFLGVDGGQSSTTYAYFSLSSASSARNSGLLKSSAGLEGMIPDGSRVKLGVADWTSSFSSGNMP